MVNPRPQTLQGRTTNHTAWNSPCISSEWECKEYWVWLWDPSFTLWYKLDMTKTNGSVNTAPYNMNKENPSSYSSIYAINSHKDLSYWSCHYLVAFIHAFTSYSRGPNIDTVFITIMSQTMADPVFRERKSSHKTDMVARNRCRGMLQGVISMLLHSMCIRDWCIRDGSIHSVYELAPCINHLRVVGHVTESLVLLYSKQGGITQYVFHK